MIRLMGLVDFGKSFQTEAELTAKQKQLDVDKDGEIEGSDLAKLRAGEKPKSEGHGGDHEVSMSHSTLDNLIKNAMELKAKMGEGEKNIPAWIQDHIAVAGNNLEQANTNYHEYQAELVPRTEAPMPEPKEAPVAEPVAEKAPEGWEGTVKAMKDEPGIDNPYALAHWMKSKGYKSHKGK